ncbi:MAG: ABC transporter permease [Promethearchaeota archaeon]
MVNGDLKGTKSFSHAYVKFFIKKAVFYLIALFIALTIAFIIPRLMVDTNDFYMIYFFELYKPIEEQYLSFWLNLIQLDLGPSISYYPMRVSEVIIHPLFYSLVLAIPILFISFFLGNWIGSKSAYLKGRANEMTYFILLILRSAPFYWLGLIIFVYFVVGNNILLSHPGASSPQMIPGFRLDYFIDLLRHYLAPFITLLLVHAGSWAVGMRAMTLHEIDSSYISYAGHLGFRKKTLRKYAQRNAILPQFTLLNLRLNELIGETLIVEYVFLWPGIGNLYLKAIYARDYPLIMGVTIVILIIAILGNFLIDITYGFIDPRIKTS